MAKLAIHACVLTAAFSASALAQEAAAVRIGTPSLIGRGEEASVFARGELVVGQMSHGIAQGLLACGLLHCSDARAWTGATLLGAAVGGGGAFFATWGGISAGPAEAINDGTVRGFLYGFMLMRLIEPPGDGWMSLLSVSAFTGAAVGLGAGLLLHPSSGQVSLVNSSSLWLALLTFAFGVPYWTTATEDGIVTLELVTTSVGLVGFSVLAAYVEMTRGRMLLIDAGGVAGALLGLAAVAFIQPKDARQIGPILGAGALLGLGTVAFLTRHLDEPKAPKVSLAPMVPRGGGFGLVAGTVF